MTRGCQPKLESAWMFWIKNLLGFIASPICYEICHFSIIFTEFSRSFPFPITLSKHRHKLCKSAKVNEGLKRLPPGGAVLCECRDPKPTGNKDKHLGHPLSNHVNKSLIWQTPATKLTVIPIFNHPKPTKTQIRACILWPTYPLGWATSPLPYCPTICVAEDGPTLAVERDYESLQKPPVPGTFRRAVFNFGAALPATNSSHLTTFRKLILRTRRFQF